MFKKKKKKWKTRNAVKECGLHNILNRVNLYVGCEVRTYYTHNILYILFYW